MDPSSKLVLIRSNEANPTAYVSLVPNVAKQLMDQNKGVVAIGDTFIYGLLGKPDLFDVQTVTPLLAQLQAGAEAKVAKLEQEEKKDEGAGAKKVKPAALRVSDTVSYTPSAPAQPEKKGKQGASKPKKEKLQGVCEFTCYTVPEGHQKAVVDFFLKAGWKEQV